MDDNTDNPFFDAHPKAQKPASFIIDMLQSVVVALFICIVLYLFIITPNQVDGYSMCPNFDDGQLLLTNKLSHWLGSTGIGQSLGMDYQRGDIVVFQKPDREKALIKRVIGMPGDKISVRDGKVYVNAERLTENYLPTGRKTVGGSYLGEGEEITVEEGKFFLMGDNRNNSLDSRYIEIEQIDRDWLQGKVILRYWPPNAFTIIGNGGEVPGNHCSPDVQR